jgi:Spy/CpxP family protein refolding chaperone
MGGTQEDTMIPVSKTRRPLAVAAGALALSAVLAGSLAANTSTSTSTGTATPPPGEGSGEPRALRRAARQLGLSEDQRKQIRGIIRSHSSEIETQMQSTRESRRALREAMDAKPADETEVRRRALALGEVRAEEAVLRARIRSQIWPVLTAEQQEKARDLRALRGHKSKRRMEAFEKWLRQDG